MISRHRVLSIWESRLYWNHPYGIIVFSLEILFVGLLIRRKNYSLVLSDGLFWLCIGTPLNWLLYIYVMKAGHHSSLLVVLKQSVNGIFNTLIASIILDYLPIQDWVRGSKSRKKVSIQQSLFHLILAMILFPTMVIMIINSRKAFFDIELGITQKLKNTAVDAAHDINIFLQRHFEGVEALAKIAAREGPVPSAALQEQVLLIKGIYPNFRAVYVANAEGVTVASSPEKNGKGDSAHRRRLFRPGVLPGSETYSAPGDVGAHHGTGRASLPTVMLSVPMLERDRIKGYASAAVDLDSIDRELERIGTMWGVAALILDEHGQPIAATKDAFLPCRRRIG